MLQGMHYETVKFIQVDIGKYQTGKIPDGHSAREATLSLSLSLANTRRVTVGNTLCEPQSVSGDFSLKKSDEFLRGNTVKELFNIRSPYIRYRIATSEVGHPFYCAERAFFFSARPCVKTECFVVHQHQEIVQQTVNHSVSHGGNAYRSPLILILLKRK